MATHPLDLDDNDLTRIDVALDALESALGGLQGLSADERMRLFKMGPKTEAFCRQALTVLELNPGTVPPVFDLPRMRAAMDRFDQLRARQVRLVRMERLLSDAMKGLGVELAQQARKGYGSMRMLGKVKGLASLEDTFSARYRRPPRTPAKDKPGR